LAVPASQVHEGDIAIYRDDKGRIFHSALVAGRDPDGNVLVNTKNGMRSPALKVRAVDAVYN
jgi:hypothetical protein